MTDYSLLPAKKLKRLIAETENTLAELKLEMEHRDEGRQSREVNRLDEHMRSAEVSLTVIRDFFHYLTAELKTEEKTDRS